MTQKGGFNGRSRVCIYYSMSRMSARKFARESRRELSGGIRLKRVYAKGNYNRNVCFDSALSLKVSARSATETSVCARQLRSSCENVLARITASKVVSYVSQNDTSHAHNIKHTHTRDLTLSRKDQRYLHPPVRSSVVSFFRRAFRHPLNKNAAIKVTVKIVLSPNPFNCPILSLPSPALLSCETITATISINVERRTSNLISRLCRSRNAAAVPANRVAVVQSVIVSQLQLAKREIGYVPEFTRFMFLPGKTFSREKHG